MMHFNPAQKTGYGGVPLTFPQPQPKAAADARAPSTPDETASHFVSGHGGFSFQDVLDVVNPLQHVPVIGTIYRAITGEKIGSLERIAGDTLYGGVWGAISSVADTAFEAVTGKTLGDTVMALFTGDKDETPKAATAELEPVLTPPAADVTALSDALLKKGVNDGVARRALYAYRKATELPALTN